MCFPQWNFHHSDLRANADTPPSQHCSTLKELAREQKKVAQKKVDAAIDKDNSKDETRALAQEACGTLP